MQALLQYRLTKSIPWFQLVMGGMQDAQTQGAAIAHVHWRYTMRKDAKGNKDWGALPDVYLKNLREATRKKREQLKIDEKDKKWLLPLQDELQKAAYEATFGTVDLVALRKAWIKAMASWKR